LLTGRALFAHDTLQIELAPYQYCWLKAEP
jgi:hypothetical protein